MPETWQPIMRIAPNTNTFRLRLPTALLAVYGLWLGLIGICLLWPAGELVRALFDDGLGGPQPAASAWRWHRALSPAFARWAQARHKDAAAAELALHDISGTEWPLFGAVFYLRATENLDRAWQTAPQGERPADYARDAIDAAADLLADPAQAHWVKQHWGEDYLQRENVFYRMLLIDALATQARLLGDTPHRALLASQVDGLAHALQTAPTGLLADYPGETFPADVAAAWHAILRADAVLGSDHRVLLPQALRGFTDDMAVAPGLPPYGWFGHDPALPAEVRGCANAWLLHHAPFLWPVQARAWSNSHTRHFWQEGIWFAGYREFEHGTTDAFHVDVDAGPVIAGLGTSASAFGLGAARTLGATREARLLGLQTVAASWPLPNGRLLVPRLMSDLSDAPLLGEAAVLYNLTQAPAPGFAPASADIPWRDVPGLVWIVLALQAWLGFAALWRAYRRLREVCRCIASTGVEAAFP